MATYRIHRFSKLTGLTPHVIRAWEKRYGLVTPTRGKNRYRQYTDEDVRFFRYLKLQIDGGDTIGLLAEFGREELLRRAQVALAEAAHTEIPAEQLVSELISAVQHHALVEFERKLNGALAVIPFEEALQRFLFPLLEQVGDLWHEGVMSVAQEHYVSNLVRQKIYSAINQVRVIEQGPTVVVACPQNESHEVGALTVAYLCASRGCRTHYLGLCMPIDELGEYCRAVRPAFMLFSLTIRPSDEEAGHLARDLAAQLVPICPVGIGGQGVMDHKSVFEKENITVFRSLKEFEIRLLTLTAS
ncbi:MAG: MerR family transcriptional regulator [Nitrospirales bacterium]|nr:MAG: MerR family transcriptional regulator [Nitrospirales bacterium]